MGLRVTDLTRAGDPPGLWRYGNGARRYRASVVRWPLQALTPGILGTSHSKGYIGPVVP